jgi:hypothetical protein
LLGAEFAGVEVGAHGCCVSQVISWGVESGVELSMENKRKNRSMTPIDAAVLGGANGPHGLGMMVADSLALGR